MFRKMPLDGRRVFRGPGTGTCTRERCGRKEWRSILESTIKTSNGGKVSRAFRKRGAENLL